MAPSTAWTARCRSSQLEPSLCRVELASISISVTVRSSSWTSAGLCSGLAAWFRRQWLDERQARELGQKWNQLAVFFVTELKVVVLASDGSSRDSTTRPRRP